MFGFLNKQHDKPTTLLAVFAAYMWLVFMLIIETLGVCVVTTVVMYNVHDVISVGCSSLERCDKR